MSAGRFVCVVGPSGAGKDTLIDLARAALREDGRFVFVRRLITRPPGTGEDHEPVSPEAFEDGGRTGAHALSWRAHGLGYAVPTSAAQAVADGRIAVCNLSRSAVPGATRRFACSVVLVTAPAETRMARIAGRARETGAAIERRVARDVETPSYDLVIDNVGEPEAGADMLIRHLRALAG